MNQQPPLQDPTDRIVADFESLEAANEAKAAVQQAGVSPSNVRIFHGKEVAADVDISKKWFADTEVEIERFRRSIANGNAILSIAIESSEQREEIKSLLAEHGAILVTHFGRWVTKTEKGDEPE